MAGHLTLAEHLRTMAREPFVWGRNDCATSIADWVRARRGVDAAGWTRGRYGTADEAARLHGPLGLPGTVRGLARQAGLVRTHNPQTGDIGVVAVRGITYCAIKTVRGWAIKGHREVVMAIDVRIVAAWSV